MDVAYFLKERTQFILFFYERAVKPFNELKQAIDQHSPPFDNPPNDYDWEAGEPPFFQEWWDADNAIQIVGLQCVSMLSDSLKLYFENLRTRVLCSRFEDERRAFKDEFVVAYKEALEQWLNIQWEKEGIDFSLIEQVVLARNRANHPEQIHDMLPDHDRKTLEKYPRPIFVSKPEMEMFHQTSDHGRFAMMRGVRVSGGKLQLAIAEIEKMADLVDFRIYGSRQA